MAQRPYFAARVAEGNVAQLDFVFAVVALFHGERALAHFAGQIQVFKGGAQERGIVARYAQRSQQRGKTAGERGDGADVLRDRADAERAAIRLEAHETIHQRGKQVGYAGRGRHQKAHGSPAAAGNPAARRAKLIDEDVDDGRDIALLPVGAHIQPIFGKTHQRKSEAEKAVAFFYIFRAAQPILIGTIAQQGSERRGSQHGGDQQQNESRVVQRGERARAFGHGQREQGYAQRHRARDLRQRLEGSFQREIHLIQTPAAPVLVLRDLRAQVVRVRIVHAREIHAQHGKIVDFSA